MDCSWVVPSTTYVVGALAGALWGYWAGSNNAFKVRVEQIGADEESQRADWWERFWWGVLSSERAVMDDFIRRGLLYERARLSDYAKRYAAGMLQAKARGDK